MPLDSSSSQRNGNWSKVFLLLSVIESRSLEIANASVSFVADPTIFQAEDSEKHMFSVSFSIKFSISKGPSLIKRRNNKKQATRLSWRDELQKQAVTFYQLQNQQLKQHRSQEFRILTVILKNLQHDCMDMARLPHRPLFHTFYNLE